jgi:hypothetical protein
MSIALIIHYQQAPVLESWMSKVELSQVQISTGTDNDIEEFPLAFSCAR